MKKALLSVSFILVLLSTAFSLVSCLEGSGDHVHTPGDWIIDEEPTCTQEGSRHKECTVCHTVS
ncbi:MAG: hypothetical protein IKB34_07830 [Clostridia bacterium]|nr:hypothetical protein [Clostridia bacterium]